MKKIYLLVSLCAFFNMSVVHAQSRLGIQPATALRTQVLHDPTGTIRTNAPGCDTINFPIPATWQVVYYVYGAGGSNGFVSGNNIDLDKEKANYFNVSATANTFLTKVWIAFGKAYSTTLTKTIPVKVYDGTTGTPGALLGTTNTTIGAIRTDVLAGNYTEIIFTPAITLPASKKFFVSVDITNASWTASPKDSLVIYSNADGQSTNSAWEKGSDNSWNSFPIAWSGLSVSLIMHPFVSTNATCTVGLPITLSAFKGEKSGYKNLLTWTSLSELNSKGYELQRSADGSDFSSIQFIATKAINGNSSTPLQYSFTDEKPLIATNYYRLKLIDKDSKIAYSNIITLKGASKPVLDISVMYPNPVVSQLNMVLQVPANSKLMLVITDMAGKALIKSNSQLFAGENKVAVDVSKLPGGIYMVKAASSNAGETALVKFVKQ